MAPFRRTYSFSSSPLCPSVPLDGSSTVLGLRDLDKHLRAAEAIAELEKQTPRDRQQQSPQLVHGSRPSYQRYKGPYLEQLTASDLQRQPQDWQNFAGVQPQSRSSNSWANHFNVPEHLSMLSERMEENLVHFLVRHTSQPTLGMQSLW